MFAKTMTAALLGSTLLATAAFAQTPATPEPAAPTTASATDSSSYQGDWRTSKLVGVNVYNDSNESLGSISDLLTNKEGQIQAVVIGVGGFLGVGERNVAIPYAKVKFVDEPVKTTSASTTTTTTAPAAGTSSTMTTGAATGASSSAAATKNPWYPDHAVISATKDELKSMTEFKYSTAK